MSTPEYDSFAAFYDLEYGHKENDLDFYLDVAEEIGGPVLEIGVGTGRVAMDLAINGFDVVGIDNSPEMLKLARNNIDQLEHDVTSKIELQCADMKDFYLDQKFPLAIIPFRAFLHNLTIDDQLATLDNIKKHLTPDGVLVLDIFVPLYNVISQDVWHDKIEQDELAQDESGISLDIKVEHKVAEQLLTIENTYVNSNDNSTHSAVMTYRYVFRYEMEVLLRCAGFTVTDVYGGFDNEPYDFKSGIMVFIAELC
jgi:SAM-dependent methyltransferase